MTKAGKLATEIWLITVISCLGRVLSNTLSITARLLNNGFEANKVIIWLVKVRVLRSHVCT